MPCAINIDTVLCNQTIRYAVPRPIDARVASEERRREVARGRMKYTDWSTSTRRKATIKKRLGRPTIVSSYSRCSVGNTPSDFSGEHPLDRNLPGHRRHALSRTPLRFYNFDPSDDGPSSVIKTTVLPLPLFPSYKSNALAYSSIGKIASASALMTTPRHVVQDLIHVDTELDRILPDPGIELRVRQAIAAVGVGEDPARSRQRRRRPFVRGADSRYHGAPHRLHELSSPVV